ncbi:23S rRNA m(5)U-1939 methyltransferase [Cognatiyoonia koreensis]|uniref:23S rRNA m(5)U-1939 methyltransferase n=1 Tax=Cognatiyoonia koreensis TaxID=364200 RepID=A0A1I0RNM7_9RHOB|nr:class I SAM-dependent RNA methyltransferase [Cognatiyoonia koreensis]SEW42854.1 23S rRNA m(5)U-1939 methyltransferase [Cognatiyoonia koreensis]
MGVIEGLTHLGLGKLDDGRSLVPRVLPGEVVEVTQEGTLRIITPSGDRVAAPCRHFKSCGGCAMQHASDPFVAEWKTGIVRKALQAHGLEPNFRTTHTSPAKSRRRSKLSARRTKKGATVGFHARASNLLIPVPDCQLLTPRLGDAIPALEILTTLVASRKEEIALTVTDTTVGTDIHIQTEQKLTSEMRMNLAEFSREYGVSRLTWLDEPVVEMAPPFQQFGKARVVPPPAAFLQATLEGENALVTDVLEISERAKTVVDLFAGCGTFTLPLAETAEVHAIEGEEPMLAALDKGWRLAHGLKRVTTETRDLFRRPLEPDELARFDAAVIDPPRAGAEAQIATLAQSSVRTIAMVSCNPVTFARDAAQLVGAGYDLKWVRVVDQFRWSSHVEMVASFTRL